MKNKTSLSQVRAVKKWKDENPEKTKYMRYRTHARAFVKKYATENDMNELNLIFQQARE